MRCQLFAATMLALTPALAQAAPSDVNAQVFYTDAKALEAKGMGALLDKRLRPMTAQMKDAGERARAANLAARKAGRPLYCPPADAGQKIGAKQVLAMLGRLPETTRRSVTLVEAWKQAMAREYPCR